MTIAIPVRVEDRRQHGWLVNIPDVELDEIAGLIRACPQARFLVQNASGVAGSILGRKDNGLPENYAVDLTRLNVEFGKEAARLIDVLGEDRLLFGSGIPFHYPGPALAKLEISQISEAVKAKIRLQNAVRWLGLS
jgi:hypothetical protein